MTALIPVVAVSPKSDFADLHFTRSATGHVHSPFFSYDYAHYHSGPIYEIGSHWHSVRFQSIAAFAHALGIQPHQVMVTEREDPVAGGKQWRLGTKHPVALPQPKVAAAKVPRLDAPGAIDV